MFSELKLDITNINMIGESVSLEEIGMIPRTSVLVNHDQESKQWKMKKRFCFVISLDLKYVHFNSMLYGAKMILSITGMYLPKYFFQNTTEVMTTLYKLRQSYF